MNGLVPQENRALDSGDQVLVQQAGPESAATPATQRKLTAEQEAVMERVQRKTDTIRDLAFAAAMAAAIPMAKDIGVAAFKVYRDGLLKEAGSPTDPVEIMLVEQLALAHHRVAQLHAQYDLRPASAQIGPTKTTKDRKKATAASPSNGRPKRPSV